MPRRRRSSPTNDLGGLLMLLLLAGYGTLAKFWGGLTPQVQWIYGTLGVLATVLLVAFFVVLVIYRKKKRKEAWERAMNAWGNRQTGGDGKTTSTRTSVRSLSPDDLEKFAMQVYRKMGYVAHHTGHTGDHGVDVRLVNPNGKVELVQCKQWNKPVGEPEVRDLMGAMIHEKAVHGYIWAPGGFSQLAQEWVKGKAIILADEVEINRLVEIAYAS